MLWIRGLVGLASLGLVLQTDCQSFLDLTGCLPEFDRLFGDLPILNPSDEGPIVLEPTSKLTTSGVFLVIQNNTDFNIEVTFDADGRTLIAAASARKSPRYEVAPPESTTVVTIQSLDLDGSWADSLTKQRMTFENGSLVEFVDETELVHVFSSADVVAGENVLSQTTVQRDVTTGTLAIVITTPDPTLTTTLTEVRTYRLLPSSNGMTLSGASTTARVDGQGNVIQGSQQTLTHIFARQFPNALQATGERDFNPSTGRVVQDFTYDPPPAEIRAGEDYGFGDTITFRVNATTVSFVVSSP